MRTDNRTNERTSGASALQGRRRLRRPAVAGVLVALLAMLLCGPVRAQVLEQVPDDALAVLKIKNLDDVSRKAAKMAKDLGLDNLNAAFGDPLGELEKQAQISKGVDGSGDLAIAFLDPAQFDNNTEKAVLALVPVSDYKAFLGNFKDANAQGDVTEAKTADGETVFLAHRGKYAALSSGKEALAKKPGGGIKLEGLAAKEADSKDALLYANMKALKVKALPEVKKGRQQLIDQFNQGFDQGAGNEAVKPFKPVIQAVIETYFNIAEQVLTDARAATIGLNLTDEGISGTVMADFEPDSYIGKLAAGNKNTTDSLLAGLPGGASRQYFVFGGSVNDPKNSSQVFHDLLDPIKTELAKVETAKQFVPALDAMEKAAGLTTGASIGWTAPKGKLGEESVIQEIAVIRGTDVKAIRDANRKSLEAMSDLFKALPQQKEVKAGFDLQKDAKTIDGISFDTYQTKMDFAGDDGQAQAAKQLMKNIYGPEGQSGMLGQVNDKTLLLLQGTPEQVATDAIAAAKANSDDLSKLKGVKAVAAQLPKSRSAVVYIDLGTIFNVAARDAKEITGEINMKPLPATLPPIGVTAGSENTAFRVDGFIPKDLISAIVSSVMQQMQQPAGNRGGGV